MKNRNLFLLAVILTGVFWIFFVGGPRVGGDYPYIFPEVAKVGFNLPQVWSFRTAEGLGEYVVSTLWAWPIGFLYGVMGKIGVGFPILERVLGIFPILILGTWGMSRLFSYFDIRGWGRFTGILFYLINTYILLVIDGGQLAIALAYSWMPIAFLAVIKSVEGSLRQKLLAGLAVSILGFFDIRFIYILFILYGLKFIFDIFFSKNKKKSILLHKRSLSLAYARDSIRLLSKYLYGGFIILLVFAGLNSYWILPALQAKAPALPATYQRASQATFLSFANLGHALFLLQPHWFKNVFGKVTELKAEFVLIPILVFLAPILRKKSKVVGFWLLVALVGVLLVKGANDPLPGVYPWLFTHVSGFSLFRDPTKFFFLVALSYSVLIGITVDGLTKRFKWKMRIGKWKVALIPLLITIYFLLLARPVWLGKMTGTFSEPIHQDEYFELAEKLKDDKEFGRIFWIPTKAPLGYSSSTHPSVEASRLVQKRPFAIGTVGTYELFNFLREAPFVGELFDISSIGYIAYPFPDIRREELKKDNIDYYNSFLDQLSSLDWVDTKLSNPPIPILRTKNHQDHFFLSFNTWAIIGSDRIYNEFINVPQFKLADNATVFLEERGGGGKKVGEIFQARLLLYEKNELDLAASFISEDEFIFPAAKLDFDPNESGWWKREAVDLIRWRAFLQEKYGIDNLDFDYGGGWAVSEGKLKLKVQNSRLKKENILLARVMKSGRGGKIDFYQGNELIGSINTSVARPEKVEIKLTGYGEIPDQFFEYDEANFSWFEVGKLVEDGKITIKTEGNINVVNSLASVYEKEWDRVKKMTSDLIAQGRVYNWRDLTENDKKELLGSKNAVEVSYEKLSPTHYKVKVEGLKAPATLAFSETYDSLWELEDKESYPLYSLINGFWIEGDGEYDIVFSAQKYVVPGLYVSAATLAVIFISLFVLSRKKSPKI